MSGRYATEQGAWDDRQGNVVITSEEAMKIQEAIEKSKHSGMEYDAARQAAHARFLLDEVRHYQALYWSNLSKLEKALGIELDSTDDYSEQTIESLLSAVTFSAAVTAGIDRPEEMRDL